MTGVLLLVTALVAQTRGPAVSAAPDDLAAVKSLYAAASFEDALTRLAQVDDTVHDPEIDEYRALCQLGLGRTADAEHSLERLVAEDPRFIVASDDVAPRFLSMFHDVRRRVLPAAARDLYATAKRSFDDKRYVIAADQFKLLAAVLKDDDMPDSSERNDLRTLSDGFVSLLDARIEDDAKAAPPPHAATPTPVPEEAAGPPVVYNEGDPGVVPPADIVRPMPPWHPTGLLGRQAEYRGTLEIVVNTRGLVESATLRKSIFPQYDAALLLATKDWRFQPATKDGHPVAYRRTFAITLSPR